MAQVAFQGLDLLPLACAVAISCKDGLLSGGGGWLLLMALLDGICVQTACRRAIPCQKVN